jgi:DNA-directed RNA polymerase specialized sigma54-like protein
MLNRVIQIIKSEDQKNPYTDDQIAKLLEVSREKITEERTKNAILDSRERRKSVLWYFAHRYLSIYRNFQR